uniref:Phosphoinositide phospholipase C n=1 Tax=Ascaris lumbricoides TaxID=6252 RepID=A0A9J2PQW0_ASCLU
MHSLAENKAIETVFNFSSLLAKHCVKQLIRVYPDGNRFNSTNYMPMFGWMVGIQMMALNFQTNGIEMQINTTMFEENGLCGYVLKPHILRDPAANINIFGDSIHSTVLANRIEIKVLSGQLLTTLSGQRSSISTYVQVDFYGLPLEQIKGRLKTKVVANNGINPVYASLKDEPFVIEKVRFPERSVVYFRLMSDRGEQLAHRVLPVHQMTNGYRHIILRNAANRPAGPASLFVHINIGFYAPPAHKALQDAFAEPLKTLIKQEEMKMNFADPLNCKIEEEQVETDEVESDDEIDYDFNFVNQERKHSAFDRLKRIG